MKNNKVSRKFLQEKLGIEVTKENFREVTLRNNCFDHRLTIENETLYVTREQFESYKDFENFSKNVIFGKAGKIEIKGENNEVSYWN